VYLIIYFKNVIIIPNFVFLHYLMAVIKMETIYVKKVILVHCVNHVIIMEYFGEIDIQEHLHLIVDLVQIVSQVISFLLLLFSFNK